MGEPPAIERGIDLAREGLAFVFAGVALHSMVAHGLDPLSVTLAGLAMGFHPEILPGKKTEPGQPTPQEENENKNQP